MGVVTSYLIQQNILTQTLSFTSILTKDCGDVKMLAIGQPIVNSTHIQVYPTSKSLYQKRPSMQKFMTRPSIAAFSGETVTHFSFHSMTNGCTFGLARKIAIVIPRHVRLS